MIYCTEKLLPVWTLIYFSWFTSCEAWELIAKRNVLPKCSRASVSGSVLVREGKLAYCWNRLSSSDRLRSYSCGLRFKRKLISKRLRTVVVTGLSRQHFLSRVYFDSEQQALNGCATVKVRIAPKRLKECLLSIWWEKVRCGDRKKLPKNNSNGLSK